MRWLCGRRLMRKTKPDQRRFLQSQNGRAWTLTYNSRDSHFWLYRKGAHLPETEPTAQLRMGERWWKPRQIQQDMIQTGIRRTEPACQDPVWVAWMLQAPPKRRRISWAERGHWEGVQAGAWKTNDIKGVLQEMREQGCAPRSPWHGRR